MQKGRPARPPSSSETHLCKKTSPSSFPPGTPRNHAAVPVANLKSQTLNESSLGIRPRSKDKQLGNHEIQARRNETGKKKKSRPGRGKEKREVYPPTPLSPTRSVGPFNSHILDTVRHHSQPFGPCLGINRLITEPEHHAQLLAFRPIR